MHASTACLLLYEDYVWVSLGNVMDSKAQAKHSTTQQCVRLRCHVVLVRVLPSPCLAVDQNPAPPTWQCHESTSIAWLEL